MPGRGIAPRQPGAIAPEGGAPSRKAGREVTAHSAERPTAWQEVTIPGATPLSAKAPEANDPMPVTPTEGSRTPSLTDDVTVGPVTLHGRLAIPPMACGRASRSGEVTEELLARDRRLLQGGAPGVLSLVTLEHHYVSPEGRATPGQPSASRDGDTEGLSREADVVHASGARAFLQLSHAGSAASSRLTGQPTLAASAVACPGAKPGHELPHAMTEREVERVVADFARAAARARLAGFDGVEVHAAHGYLLDQFLSPLTNHRADRWGGGLEGRARLLLRVVEAVHRELGSGMALSVRLGACDYLPGGLSIDEGVQVARWCEARGADLLSVSGGMCYYSRVGHDEPGWFADASRAVRAAVGVPVMLAGGVRTLAQAQDLVRGGACDLVGVGRAIANNPKWLARELRRQGLSR